MRPLCILDVGSMPNVKAQSVVGIDIAEEMVHLANSYAKTLSRCNMRFELMDGEHTTFTDNTFDAVLCSYGIFLPDMATGVTEWQRVTKPGGWVCFSAFGGDGIPAAVRFV